MDRVQNIPVNLSIGPFRLGRYRRFHGRPELFQGADGRHGVQLAQLLVFLPAGGRTASVAAVEEDG